MAAAEDGNSSVAALDTEKLLNPRLKLLRVCPSMKATARLSICVTMGKRKKNLMGTIKNRLLWEEGANE